MENLSDSIRYIFAFMNFKIQMCKVAEFLFRYSGAVVHMAIFSESFYIVSLLNYPFYTVNFGYKILIGISWRKQLGKFETKNFLNSDFFKSCTIDLDDYMVNC